MKILLIVPTHGYQDYPTVLSASDFPTGLAYIASALKEAGHEVIGLNLNNIRGYGTGLAMITNEIERTIMARNPDMIATGGICTDFHFLRDAINVIRKCTDKPIVLGGGIVTNDHEYIINLLKPDYAIVGEGEEVIVQLANNHYNVSDIKNIGYWEDGKAVFNTIDYHYGDINLRPLPDYDVFNISEMIDKYSYNTRLLYRYSRLDPRPMVIVTARGCPYSCSFCVHDNNRHYRARSIDSIMSEIKQNYEKYKFNILIIVDELFAVDKKRMKDFCNALLVGKEAYGWDFDWMFQTHANAKLDKEALELAKKAGCYLFSYGLESASPTVLKSMNKHMNISQIIEAIELSKQVGIGFSGNLIMGDPAETPETIQETLEFYFKHCKYSFVFLAFMMPYPGSRVFDYCVSHGMIKDKVAYYEHIGNMSANMTRMPNEEWIAWSQLFSKLERSWLYVEDTDVEKHEYLGNGWQNLYTTCPHCGEKLLYRERVGNDLDNASPLHFLGTGCLKCNQKIRVNFKPRNKTKVKAKELVEV